MAGDGQEGSDEGDAMEASFSFPGGIALYYDSSEGEFGESCAREREKEREERTAVGVARLRTSLLACAPEKRLSIREIADA